MATSLADTLAAMSGHTGYRCSISSWLKQLPDAARSEIIGAFTDVRVSDAVLCGWMATNDGPDLSRNQVGHHRRGQCSTCKREGFDLKRASA